MTATESAARADASFAGTPRFEILRQLGRGGMGAVYEALDREQGTRVALKTLLTLNADSLRLFKNEFRALQDLTHPNLVHLGELLEHEGQWFFTMELVPGVELLEYVRPGSSPPARARAEEADTAPLAVASSTPPGGEEGQGDEAWRAARSFASSVDEARLRAVLVQLARAVNALHAAGKVHRDIKPSNVLVAPDGRAVLLDFGLILGIDAGVEPFLASGPASGMVLGTYAFMAPEQAAAGAVGPAADWYAVGVLLYLALTGEVPFRGAADTVLAMKHLVVPEAPRHRVPDVPADLDALCMDLLRADPAARPGGAEVMARLADEAPALAVEPEARGVFVGRVRELALLDDAFASVRPGAPVVVFVHGESGIGKSALVSRFLASARVAGRARVLAGRCHERESVPYKALDEIVDALSRHLGALPAEEVAPLLPAGAHLLLRVFPVLCLANVEAAAVPETRALDPQQMRARLFAAMRELLTRVARSGPLVLSIDDLQWADADSLSLLAEILRPPDAPSLLLLATVRAYAAAQPGTRGAEELARAIPCDLRHQHLEPLGATETRALATLLLERAPGARLSDAAALADEAAGHPMFLDALVRHRAAARDEAAPPRLDDALWRQMERATPRARDLLTVLAVAGLPIAQSVAAEAAGAPFEDYAKLAAELRGASLARTSGTRTTDAVEPYHDRIRQALLARLDDGARRSCHARLARALEARSADDAESLAIHWFGAGDERRAATYAARAGDRASTALAFDRAVRLYAMALEIAPHVAAAEASLRVKLADALANAGRGGEAGDAYLRAIELAPEAEEVHLRRRAAEQLLKSGRVDRGLAALREVLATVGMKLPPTPQRSLASLLVRRAQLWTRGIAFEPREPAAIPPGDVLAMDICHSAAIGLGMVDNLRAADFQTRGLLMALRAGDASRVAVGLALEASFVATAGQKSASRTERLRVAARDLAVRVGRPHAVAMAELADGVASVLLARWRRGLAALDRAQSILVEQCTGVAWELETTRLMALWCLWHLGEVHELRRRRPAYLRDAEAKGDLFAITNYRSSYVANAWLTEDDPARARSEAALAIASWSQQGFHLQHYYHLYAEAQAALYVGDGAGARAMILREWENLRRSLLLRIELARTTILDLRARGALAAATSDRSNREALLREAASDARALVAARTSTSVPLGVLVECGIANQRGDRARAFQLAQRAGALFHAEGMFVYEAAARLREAELSGGDRGAALARAVTDWLRGRGIVAPARFCDLLAPGFAPAA